MKTFLLFVLSFFVLACYAQAQKGTGHLTGTGLPTGIYVVKILGESTVKVNGALVDRQKLPVQLRSGDVVDTAGNALISSGFIREASQVEVKDASFTVLGSTESIMSLSTWDLMPRSGSYLAKESTLYANLDRLNYLQHGFLANRYHYPLPIAFRQGSSRLYAPGSELTLQVSANSRNGFWTVNLIRGRLALDHSGRENISLTSSVSFRTVTGFDGLVIKDVRSMTLGDLEFAINNFRTFDGSRRVHTVRSVRVRNPSGLRINGLAPETGDRVTEGDKIECVGNGGSLLVNSSHVLELGRGVTMEFSEDPGNRFMRFEVGKYVVNGYITVTNLYPNSRSIPLPILAARGSVALYSYFTLYTITFKNNAIATLHVKSHSAKFISFLDSELLTAGQKVDRMFK